MHVSLADLLFHGGGSFLLALGLLIAVAASTRRRAGRLFPEWLAVVLVVVIGAVVEIVQSVLKIDSGWSDVVVDAAGALAAWAAWRGTTRSRPRSPG